MANIAALLKEEISRIARKELRGETDILKKANNRYRGEIAKLKRRITQLERQLKSIQKFSVGANVANANSESPRYRFSASGLKKLRQRHGLSAATLGKIVGSSLQTIYNWETGKTRPSPDQIEKIAILRRMSKREFQHRLAAERAST